MKKVMMLMLAACASSTTWAADKAPELQPLEKIAPWPQAEKGMKRLAITLPEQQDENAYKVELIPGRTMEVDCNQHRAAATLETHTLEGWGYDYYVLSKISEPVSTRMACHDNTKTQKFVVASLGNAAIMRYNSKLPIVVYAPNNVEVRYRIWKADELMQKAIER